MAAASPLLDEAGNSVRGVLTAAYLSRTLGLDLLASAPATAQRDAETSPTAGDPAA